MKRKRKSVSEKYFEKVMLPYAKKVNSPVFSQEHIKTYGKICRLEGQINALNSYGLNEWMDRLLPKFRAKLKAIAEANNLLP